MYKWLIDCKTAEAGKARYRELVRKYHPDNGGSGEELKEISVEFKSWFTRYKGITQQPRHSAKEGCNSLPGYSAIVRYTTKVREKK